MKHCLFFGLFFLIPFAFLQAQGHCRIVFYNIENLFDFRDDLSTEDDEFTPGGMKHWTCSRYVDKLRKISEVIDSIGRGEPPVFVGLAEVENRDVLEDLSQRTILAKSGYQIIHRDSPDKRGIDVALLYRKNYFRLLDSAFWRLSFSEDTTLLTRDILYAKGLFGGDTLHFFVCHFPSMVEGERKTEWRRERVAEVLRSKLDSVWRYNSRPLIIVLGDMNGKANTSAQMKLKTLDADNDPITQGGLYNLGYYLLKENRGSYRYRGHWQTMDHILVSGALLDGKSACKVSLRLSVYSPSFLLEEDKTHSGFKPFPTYRGLRYIGGYSDHLPVFIDLY